MTSYSFESLYQYAKPVRRTEQAQKLSFSETHPSEHAWIMTSTFDFAVKMQEVLERWGLLTEGQLRAVQKCMRIEDQRAQAAKRADAEDSKRGYEQYAPTTVADLRGVPDGMYAVPNGETRLKVKIQRGTGKWEGYIFVSDGAEYGQRQRYGMQKPGAYGYVGRIDDAVISIVKNPAAASAAYGRLVGRCGICGRTLEDEESVARGIGPVCAGKYGW